MGTVMIIIIIAALSATGFVQIGARQQVDVVTARDPHQVASAIESCFGASWNRVAGPGKFNYKPRLRMHAPTLSVSIDANGPSGNCDVSIWMSAYKAKLGVAAHAMLIWRKKRSVVARLSAAELAGPRY